MAKDHKGDEMMEETMNYYKRLLERKERRVSRLQQKNHDYDGGLETNEYITMMTLEAEIRLVKEFMEDLEWIQKGAKP